MAPLKQEKSKKKGFTARMKALFRKSSRSAIPAQQVISQTPHYATDWQPPAPPDDGLLGRHLHRMASLNDLPQVDTYPNFDRQVVRVAHGSRTSLDNVGALRQPSSETKDTWERSTALTEATSSRVTSGKRLTVLMEDEIARPSSSIGQVGILNRLKGFEESALDFTDGDPRRHASALLQALRDRERELDELEARQSEDDTDEISSVIRWRSNTRDSDYYRPGASSRQETAPQMNNLLHSGNNDIRSWSQQPTIRRVSSSPSAGASYNTHQNQDNNKPVQRQADNEAQRASSATESVYSKDEDRVPIRRESVSPNPDQGLHGYAGNSPRVTRMNAENYYEIVGDSDGERMGGRTVDNHSGGSSSSIARPSPSSGNVNLTRPRGTTSQNTPFHGVTNDRLQHVPPQFSLRDFISAHRASELQEAKRQPSLAELREQIRNEDAAQHVAAHLAVTQPEVHQVRLTSPGEIDHGLRERINIDSPYPSLNSEIVRETYGTTNSTSSNHQARQSTTPSEQILASRELNHSQTSVTLRPTKQDIDPERTPRPRPSQESNLRLENIMHTHGLRRRSRSRSRGISSSREKLRFGVKDSEDPFLQDPSRNVWASRSSSRVQQEPGTTGSTTIQQSSFGPSRVLPRNRFRETVRGSEYKTSSRDGVNTRGREEDRGFSRELSRESTNGPAFI